MFDLCAAETAHEEAVTRKTHNEQARLWRRWTEYCQSIGLEDNLYLDEFSRHDKNRLMGAFAMAMQERKFS